MAWDIAGHTRDAQGPTVGRLVVVAGVVVVAACVWQRRERRAAASALTIGGR
jgi:hypothetical protein